MDELGEFISANKNILTTKLHKKIDSFLDLHLPGCLLSRDDLSTTQIYNELSLHAYGFHMIELPYARKIMNLRYLFLNHPGSDNPDVVNEVIKKTYKPLARKLIKKKFRELSNHYVNDEFYNLLPGVADYTGIRYLARFLQKEQLPEIRKPREDSKRDKVENLFILNAFTSYKEVPEGVIKQPRRNHNQFCAWCEYEFNPVYHYKALADTKPKFNHANGCGLYYYKQGKIMSIRMVPVKIKENTKEKKNKKKREKKITFFVCSKHCYDALRLHFLRHPILPKDNFLNLQP